MKQAFVGAVGILATGAVCAESYSFTVKAGASWTEQTIINCTGPKTNGGRVPQGCTLRERSIAYPNHDLHLNVTDTGTHDRHTTGVACAAGHPIEFYPNGTLAACTLDAEQPAAMPGFTIPVLLGNCKGPVRFDKDGGVEC